MKEIQTNGITFIEQVPGGTAEWFYGISRELGDLFEAEEIFLDGRPVVGNELCLIHYPDGEVFRPIPKEAGTYFENAVFSDGCIYILKVDFSSGKIFIFCFDCVSHAVNVAAELPLASVKNCYNLMLHTAPVSLTRQGNEGMFEILWPENTGFEMDPHESFFLRDGGKLYFNKWFEEGEGQDYRYWEKTIVRELNGHMIETLTGDVMVMPNGEMWHLAGGAEDSL